jgi:hypothetical protein
LLDLSSIRVGSVVENEDLALVPEKEADNGYFSDRRAN